MASYQVLPQPTVGPSQGLGRGMDMVSNNLNLYTQAMMKDKFEKQKRAEDYNALWDQYQQFKDNPGYDAEFENSSNGASWRMKRKAPKEMSPDDALKHVELGIASPEEEDFLGKRMGISRPPSMIDAPGMSMLDGSTKNIAQPNPEDYRTTMLNKIYPDYAPSQVAARAGGMQKYSKSVEGSIPPEFVQDYNQAYHSANGDQAKFLDNISALADKYPDNPKVQNELMKLMSANTKQTKSKRRPVYK